MKSHALPKKLVIYVKMLEDVPCQVRTNVECRRVEAYVAFTTLWFHQVITIARAPVRRATKQTSSIHLRFRLYFRGASETRN